jgi:ubiquinone/menaquinone biosynthesis C-methylase UbiE
MPLWSDRVLPHLIDTACRSRAILEERRRWIPRAHGRVLEIGIGSGLNLVFYDPDRVERIIGIDPSPPLLARAEVRARKTEVPVELVEAAAERLPLPDASFDSAVITYTLCSVADPVHALDEIRRVLRPGGELVFVEHGLAPDPGPRRWQRRLTPVWRRVSGGCHLDRDIPELLERAGYQLDELAAAYVPGARWLSFTFEGSARP